MSVGLTMGFSICASLLSSVVGRVGTSTGSKTVTVGGGFGVLSRSSAVSVRFSALELRPGYTRFSSDGAWFPQCILRLGRQLIQNLPAFLQQQLVQRPRCHYIGSTRASR